MKRTLITNKTGNPLARNSRAAVRRVMRSPVNVTADSAKDYALCHCEAKGASIARYGRSRKTCVYHVAGENYRREFAACDREEAIAEFFSLVFGSIRREVKPASAVPAGMLF